jgi:cation:H+ antiporter
MGHWNLILEFIVFAAVTWIAGIWLTRTTDAIDTKYRLGDAFGGLLILGVATSLPELAVVVSAALQHHYDIIIGTLVGGIAIQTVAISIFDARMHVRSSITFAAASLTLVLEATVVILVTVAAILAIRMPAVIGHTNISVASILIFGLWLFGLYLVFHARKGLPWRSEAIAANPGREHHERRAVINHPFFRHATNLKIFGIFTLASLATLAAGVGLQVSGNKIAVAYSIGGGLFAATFIAFAGALPNLSTGLSSIDIGDYKLAISDIFGGNAFMPALFLVCDILAGHAVLQHATPTDVWFAALGVLLTGIYIIGLIVRPRKQYFRMGIDSISVITLYVVGVIILSITGG